MLKRKITSILFSSAMIFIITLFLSEMGLMLLSRAGLISFHTPSYSIEHKIRYWADLNKYFGVWHPPYSKEYHSKNCFGVEYNSNSYGARDIERTKEAVGKRAVVLGDSFIEGYGLESKYRLTNILEAATGIQHLNFGTSGTFGTIQQSLQYQHMANNFEHDIVILAILPRNDFQDNDHDYGKLAYNDRYRPYYVGTYPDYEVVYHVKDLKDATFFRDRTDGELIRGNLRNYLYTYNVLSDLKHQYKRRNDYDSLPGLNKKELIENDGGILSGKNNIKQHRFSNYSAYSGYYDYSENDILIMKSAIENIASIAKKNGRRLFVFTIPVLQDFQRESRDGKPPLVEQLASMSGEIGFSYVDLLVETIKIEKDFEGLYHECDDHWSARGNMKSAEIIQKFVYGF